MRYAAFAVAVFALAATPAFAGSAKVEVLDAATLRVSAPPKAGVKFAKMRASLLRTAAQETLDRGYDWFDLTEVVDLSRERSVDLLTPDYPSTAIGISYTGLVLVNVTPGPSFSGGSVHLVEPGASATIRMGKGPRPEGATIVDARQMLKSLR